MPTPAPTMRKDAERNRQRLLQAARELFAERGFGVTLNDIAHHAGVGVGTAYRRFANKEEVMDALFEQQIEETDQLVKDCLAEPDAWVGLTRYFEESMALQVKDRGLAQLLSGRRIRPDQHDWSRDRLAPLVNQIADRAREQGAIRDDVTGTDLIFIQIGLNAILELTRAMAPELHRRYLWLALNGLRADADQLQVPVDAPALALTHEIMGQQRSTTS